MVIMMFTILKLRPWLQVKLPREAGEGEDLWIMLGALRSWLTMKGTLPIH